MKLPRLWTAPAEHADYLDLVPGGDVVVPDAGDVEVAGRIAVAAIDHRVRTLLDDQGECAAVDLEWRIAPSTPIRSTRSIPQSPGGNNSFGVISGNFDCKEDEISISADIDFPIDNTKSENSS